MIDNQRNGADDPREPADRAATEKGATDYITALINAGRSNAGSSGGGLHNSAASSADPGHPPDRYACRVNRLRLLSAVNSVKFKSEVAKFEGIDPADRNAARKLRSLKPIVLVFESNHLWLAEEHEHGRSQVDLAIEWITPPPDRPRAITAQQYAFEILLANSDKDELIMGFEANPKVLRCAIGQGFYGLPAEAVTVPDRIDDAPADLEARMANEAAHISLLLKLASAHSAKNPTSSDLESVTLENGTARGGRTAAVTLVTSETLKISAFSVHYSAVEFLRTMLGRSETGFKIRVTQDRVQIWTGLLRVEVQTTVQFPPLEPVLAALQQNPVSVRAHVGELAWIPALAQLVRPTNNPKAQVPVQFWKSEIMGDPVLVVRSAMSHSNFKTIIPLLASEIANCRPSTEQRAIPLPADPQASSRPFVEDPQIAKSSQPALSEFCAATVAENQTTSADQTDHFAHQEPSKDPGDQHLETSFLASTTVIDRELEPIVDICDELEESPPTPKLWLPPPDTTRSAAITALHDQADLTDTLGSPLVTVNGLLIKKALESCRPEEVLELRLRRSALTLRIERDLMTITHVLIGKN